MRKVTINPTFWYNPNACDAYLYARDVIKDRWPEAEPVIMKNPKWAYFYACYIIEGRWPEAEPIIMKNPKYAYYYACDIVKGRWFEAEPYIAENHDYHSMYQKSVPHNVTLTLQTHKISNILKLIVDFFK